MMEVLEVLVNGSEESFKTAMPGIWEGRSCLSLIAKRERKVRMRHHPHY